MWRSADWYVYTIRLIMMKATVNVQNNLIFLAMVCNNQNQLIIIYPLWIWEAHLIWPPSLPIKQHARQHVHRLEVKVFGTLKVYPGFFKEILKKKRFYQYIHTISSVYLRNKSYSFILLHKHHKIWHRGSNTRPYEFGNFSFLIHLMLSSNGQTTFGKQTGWHIYSLFWVLYLERVIIKS